MWKWVSWVVRTGATALLLSFLCIWTTGYIVNSYVESIVKQLELPLDTQPFALSGIWGMLWGADKPDTEEAQQPPPPEPSDPLPAGEASPTQSVPIESEDVSGLPEGEAGGETDGEAGSSVTDGDPDGLAGEESEGVGAGVSPPDQAVGADSLTEEQRSELYASVVSKLNPEQLKLLSDFLQDGLTQEELALLDDSLRTSLSEQEYKQMIAELQRLAPGFDFAPAV